MAGAALAGATTALFALVIAICMTYKTDILRVLQPKREAPVLGDKVFTAEQLLTYDGTDPSSPLYLCVLGEIFDVTAGAKHYGKGQGYNVFVGKDSSKSFHTGDWANPDPDVRSLNVLAVAEIVGWRKFYREHKQYAYVGVLHGIYYNADGTPTDALAEVEAMSAQAADVEKVENDKRAAFPGCDMAHTAATKQTRIVCPSKGEVRYPRLHSWAHVATGEQVQRCSCITARELSRDLPFSSKVEVYNGCQSHESECTITQG